MEPQNQAFPAMDRNRCLVDGGLLASTDMEMARRNVVSESKAVGNGAVLRSDLSLAGYIE